MGFADLSIADIAADYNSSVAEVLRLCDRLGIAYKNAQTRLALEDAKAIISEIMAQRDGSGSDRWEAFPPESNSNLTSEQGDPNDSVSSESERSRNPQS